MTIPTHWFAVSLLLVVCGATQANAQSAAEVIEKARAEAREFNEYKTALEDPDQSMRLALFESMLALESAPLRMMAIQAGINSTDNIMRSRALQAQILSLDQLHIQLEVNPAASTKFQDATRAFIEKNAGTIAIRIQNRDKAAGSFTGSGFEGQIRNLLVQLMAPAHGIEVNLSLQDDNTVQGIYEYRGGSVNALATLRLF